MTTVEPSFFTVPEREHGLRDPKRAIATGPDLVGLYLEGAGSFPLLTKADEMRLGQAVQAGHAAKVELAARGGDLSPRHQGELRDLGAEGDRATELFINSNLRLVVSVARKYQWSSLPLLDLIQEGNLGLMHAVEMFDWRKGFKFSTYATWWVRQSVSRAIENTARTVRVPAHVGDEIRRARRLRAELEADQGVPPTFSALAEALDMDERMLAQLFRYDNDPVSLDVPIGEDGGTTLGDLVPSSAWAAPVDLVSQAMLGSQVQRILGLLPEAERRVLTLRYGIDRGEPRTQAVVGKILDLSADRVRRIEHGALTKLRRTLAGSDARELLAS
jgi:RNA polymerase sigma factor (sigma-70 family)